MFDFVRSHTRLFLGIVVLLIIPSFVFFGVQGYSSFTDGANTKVAEVDGRGITQVEWDAAHQRNIQRYRQQMPNIDVKLLDSPAVKRETLDGIVRERVLLAASEHMHMGVSDERLQRVFSTDPQFASAAQSRRQRQSRPAGRAGHELRDVRAEPAPGPGHAPGAAGHRRHGGGAEGGGRPVARRAAAAPPGADAALRCAGLPQQGQPDRCRHRGLLQGQRSAVPGARAGAHRIRAARPADACRRA